MSDFNELQFRGRCPRCGWEGVQVAQLKIGIREQRRYTLGDRVSWAPSGRDRPGTPRRDPAQLAVRPPHGDVDAEAWCECARCKRDFWLEVHVRNDVLASASLDLHREPLLPGLRIEGARPDRDKWKIRR